MKLLMLTGIILLFTNNASVKSDEFDDLVVKIMTEPEYLFVYICDTNLVFSNLCKQLDRYQSVMQGDIEIFAECKMAKLLNKQVEKNDSSINYFFYYDFPQYYKELAIWFHFKREYKSGKMKFDSYFIYGRINDGFIKKIIGNPDSLDYYARDTNYIDDVMWELTKMGMSDIKNLKEELNYIKRNKLKPTEIDFQFCRDFYYATYDDPKNNSKIELWFFYANDAKSGRYKIRSMDAKRQYYKNN